MAKSLTQIAFDFSVPPEPEIAPAPPAPVVQEEPLPLVQEEPLPAAEEDPAPPTVTETAPGKTKKTVSTTVRSKRGRRSLKDIEVRADLVQVPEDEVLFRKQYYSIGEVAVMFRENQSLIRYWETEFDILQPRKNRKGDRFFRPVDIKNLVLIYDLLRRRKFTIDGAKDYLKKNKKAEEKFRMIQELQKVKAFLLEMKASL